MSRPRPGILADAVVADAIVAVLGAERRSLRAVVQLLGDVAAGDLVLTIDEQPVVRGVSSIFLAGLRTAVRDRRIRIDLDAEPHHYDHRRRVGVVRLVPRASPRWYRVPLSSSAARRAAALLR